MRVRRCPHTSVGDNLRARPPPLDNVYSPEQCPLALLLLGQGVREREKEHACLLGPARLLTCSTLPFTNQEVNMASRCTMA